MSAAPPIDRDRNRKKSTALFETAPHRFNSLVSTASSCETPSCACLHVGIQCISDVSCSVWVGCQLHETRQCTTCCSMSCALKKSADGCPPTFRHCWLEDRSKRAGAPPRINFPTTTRLGWQADHTIDQLWCERVRVTTLPGTPHALHTLSTR